ncbi:hypothetical protein [Rhodoblastus sp.]|jgi:hypothetical protein|uniref:hypothetical protein n=1 Tax=Rhodoblastus sp. TaxID=1962975 RepID=UPI0025D04AD8|nr:hypothetical protein [Rhodoblastus sp.]
MLTKTEQNIFVLKEIHCRIDAINAAVQGADFNDHSQQRGISGLLGDMWCKLDDFIKELEGEAEGEANGQD